MLYIIVEYTITPSSTKQSLIAPLGSVTLVANVLFAPLLVGERMGNSAGTYVCAWKCTCILLQSVHLLHPVLNELIATVAIIAGAVLAVYFASHEDEEVPYECVIPQEHLSMKVYFSSCSYTCVRFETMMSYFGYTRVLIYIGVVVVYCAVLR